MLIAQFQCQEASWVPLQPIKIFLGGVTELTRRPSSWLKNIWIYKMLLMFQLLHSDKLRKPNLEIEIDWHVKKI